MILAIFKLNSPAEKNTQRPPFSKGGKYEFFLFRNDHEDMFFAIASFKRKLTTPTPPAYL